MKVYNQISAMTALLIALFSAITLAVIGANENLIPIPILYCIGFIFFIFQEEGEIKSQEIVGRSILAGIFSPILVGLFFLRGILIFHKEVKKLDK